MSRKREREVSGNAPFYLLSPPELLMETVAVFIDFCKETLPSFYDLVPIPFLQKKWNFVYFMATPKEHCCCAGVYYIELLMVNRYAAKGDDLWRQQ